MKTKVHTIYKLKDKTRVPGATTITGMLDKGNALIHWAWKLGCDGIDYRKFADDKAAIGTLAHDMIVSHLTGEETDFSDYSKNQIDQAENSCLSYYEWEKGKEISVLFAEKPLVSEEYKYGGTADIVAVIDGTLTLLDLKTGSAIYPEMAIQLAAYNQLLIESAVFAQSHQILRIGRSEDEGFEVKQYGKNQMDAAWEIFENLINIYYRRKELK